MAQIQTADNKFGVSQWIVNKTAGLGTHTTITAAMAAASAGQDIFIMPGTYTENFTITPGVNLTAFAGDEITPNVIINGTVTMTGAGTSVISGIQLQTNSANLLVVSGSAASIIYLQGCYLNCTNNTGISFTSSSATSNIILEYCRGALGTTGIAYFADTSAGILSIHSSFLYNAGLSTTANTKSGGTLTLRYSLLLSPLTSSSACIVTLEYSTIENPATNTTSLTHNSTAAGCTAISCFFSSGSASAISIGAGATLIIADCTVSSSNTNAITGSGTLQNCGIFFNGTSSVINTTTVTSGAFDAPSISFDGGTNLLNKYTQGTWTPALAFGGSATGITYTTQTGRYTRIGNTVSIQGTLTLSSKGAQTGNATITGLPIAANSDTNQPLMNGVPSTITLTTLYTQVYVQPTASATTASVGQAGSAQGVAAVTNTSFANNSSIFVSGTYFV